MVDVLPICLSLITCEQVAFDPLSGKPSILGVIHELKSPVFPTLSSRVVAWAELTGGRGVLPLDFIALMTDPESGALVPIAVARVSVRFPDPLTIRITGAHMEGLPLIGPGSLVVRLSLGEAVIMERRISVEHEVAG